MSRIKLLLDVVEDMRSLATSLEIMVNAMMDIGSDADASSEATATITVATKHTVESQPAITLEQLRAKLGEVSSAGYTSEVRELIAKRGAQNLSGLDPGEYEGLLNEAAALMEPPW